MHVILERAYIADAIARVSSIVEQRVTVPILKHVVLNANDNTLGVTATDLEIDVSDAVPAEVRTPGALAVPALMLNDIVKRANGAEVALKFDPKNDTLDIVSGKAKFRLPCLSAQDFPNVHELGVVKASFNADIATFMGLLETTKHAVSTELTRHYLRGVFLQSLNASTLRAVATNGHVLALRDLPAPAGAGGLDGVLLPSKLVNTLSKILAGTDEERMDVAISGVRVQFKVGALTLTSKLIDGTFPDYQRVIPTSHTTRMIADAALMAGAVDRVGSIAQTGIGLHINASLHITARGTDGGEGEDIMDIDHTGPNVSIGFNAAYVKETLSHIDADAIWELNDAGSPAVIKDSSDASKLFVLMPMRL